MIRATAHVSFLVDDVTRSLFFYCEVLGMALNETRPDFAFEGAWIDIGDSGQQIHLMRLPNPDSGTDRPAHGGRDRHIALLVEDVAALELTLIKHDIAYTKSQSGRAALFCRDPDGNALEFAENFVVKK